MEEVKENQPENITLETFHNITVRKVVQNGKGMIPVVDISSATHIDRSNLSKLLKRNEKFFKEYQGVVKIATPGGVQSLTCLTRDGVLGLLFKVDAVRSKNEETQDLIIEFQHWATRILSQNKVGHEIQTVLPIINGHPFTPIDHLNEQLDIADSIIKRTGMRKELAHSMAIVLASDKSGTDLHCYATYLKAQTQLPLLETEPVDRKEFNSMKSLRELAYMMKLPEDKVRNVLESIGIIYYENRIWKLTAKGEQFGKAYLVTIGYPYRSQQKAWIRYNDLCIDLLKKYFDVQVPV
jgi:hypothetical protein